MTVLEHGYDWAWAQIGGGSVRSNGGTFVVRYLGGSARLTPQERDNLHADGVKILLVMEQEATLAEGGYARGVSAAQQANDEADGLNYPPDCPILYADDNNDPDPEQETEFMRGVKSVARRKSDMYSGGNVLAALGGLSEYGGWMVETWFPHSGADPFMIQLANTREPAMVGVDASQYDTNLLLKPIPMWGPGGVVGSSSNPMGDFDVSEIDDKVGPWLKDVEAHIEAHIDETLWKWVSENADPLLRDIQKRVGTAPAPDTSALEAKVSGWFGKLQDHIDEQELSLRTAISAIPAMAGALKLADIGKEVHRQLAKLSLTVKS